MTGCNFVFLDTYTHTHARTHARTHTLSKEQRAQTYYPRSHSPAEASPRGPSRCCSQGKANGLSIRSSFPENSFTPWSLEAHVLSVAKAPVWGLLSFLCFVILFSTDTVSINLVVLRTVREDPSGTSRGKTEVGCRGGRDWRLSPNHLLSLQVSRFHSRMAGTASAQEKRTEGLSSRSLHTGGREGLPPRAQSSPTYLEGSQRVPLRTPAGSLTGTGTESFTQVAKGGGEGRRRKGHTADSIFKNTS